jgi:Mn-dependent DtxR family transcriptional regulator
MTHGHSVDEYLETIYFLAFPIGEYGPVVRDSPALAARVAEMLGVSAPSASEMLKRMEGEGLIARGHRKEALLTVKGRAAAERVVRRHRLVERLLTDFMGYTPAESHEHADALGEVMTDDMVERISHRLGDPERCPHGWPVDPSVEQAENRELVPLVELAPPCEATIVRLAEHDGELLRWFYDQGLVPGTRVVLERVEAAADQLTVRVDGEDRALSGRAAAGLFVRPLAERVAG